MKFSSVVAFAASFAVASAVPAANANFGPGGGGAINNPCTNKVANISPEQKLTLFKAFNTQLSSATTNASQVAAAFGKYVDPNMVEHSAGATNVQGSIGFLTALYPTITVNIIANLIGCFGNICTVHTKATPNNSNSLISNVTAISDYYRYDGSCIVEHWDSVQTADANTINPAFPEVCRCRPAKRDVPAVKACGAQGKGAVQSASQNSGSYTNVYNGNGNSNGNGNGNGNSNGSACVC